jgi:pyridoxamine 5'-phosphate oxidase
MADKFADIRREYEKKGLTEDNLSHEPLEQLGTWLNDALNAEVPDPTAMILSTADNNCRPSSRVVLFKGFSEKGITFYTNFNSRKATELDGNPYLSLLFYWPDLERQIRVDGQASKVSGNESDLYFAQRPRTSQLAAWISPQSSKIPDRNFLDNIYNNIDSKFTGKAIIRPPFWGGYIVKPEYFEFWQGRVSRLHDRISYTLDENTWKIRRLAP